MKASPFPRQPAGSGNAAAAASPLIASPAGPVLVDDPGGIVITGCEPRSEVVVRARVEGEGAVRQAVATFRADETGAVDTARAASLAGTYTGVDPFGLWWSGEVAATSAISQPSPVTALVRAEAGGRHAEIVTERLWLVPGVSLTQVREPGIWGLFARPPGNGPFPAVVAFGGSGGGLGPAAEWAAVLASRGIAVLAIAYFGVPGLPAALVRIDVEVVERAASWLLGQTGVKPGKVAVMGGSRGSELALLAGALLDCVGAVVAFAPSGLTWGGVDASGPVPAPAWRFGGQDIPYLDLRPAGGPDDQAPPRSSAELMAHHAALSDRDPFGAAEIPIERVSGPILMVSGEADAMWPSTPMACIAQRRAAEHGFAHELTHLRYPGAGHQCGGVPGTPTISQVRHPVTGQVYTFGGSPAADARARADSWPHVLRVLRHAADHPRDVTSGSHP